MKSTVRIAKLVAALVITGSGAALAAPYMKVNGSNGDYATFHYYIDESLGQSDGLSVEFWPNEAGVETVELWSNLNNRDLATLYPPDPNTVSPGQVQYYSAYTMKNEGGGRYSISMPITKCGAYRLTCRYKVGGSWRWYQGRDTAVVVSDTAARDLIIYALQVNAVDATGDDWASRSTFDSLHDNWRFNLNYVSALGANTLWLMPFHPIGSKVDGNYGSLGSPYSIKNMWQVGEHLGSSGTREDAMYDFQQFCYDAESKGVGIMFDTIFNHTAKDAELQRNPNNPYQQAANPFEQIRSAKPNWYSKYTGSGYCNWTLDPGGSPPYEYWASADHAGQVGPAPADRHDFGKWCDTIDLFWGTYGALGNPQSEDDRFWNASDEVKKLTEYFAAFFQHWLEATGGTVDGFRCDFAQGLPPQAWEYLINRAKSQKPELAFMAESLDGGAVSRRAGRHFDIINDSWVWAMLGGGTSATGIRGIVDERRAAYGYAGVMRGLINHDQSAPADKWYTLSRYAVGCALDGAPQMFMGQELGYRDGYGFSKFRNEFDRLTPNIREYYNMQALWNDGAPDKDALWNRYAEVNKGRMRAYSTRIADQYYLDQTRYRGTHEKIFAVMKYSKYGWDAADQDVVLCFVNLEPGQGHYGTFHIAVPSVYLNPNKQYNVRNLASTKPNDYLWPTARSGSDLAANGVYVQFPSSVYQEGAVAQFLKLEAVGNSQQLWAGNTYHWPWTGELDAGEDLWVNTETWPVSAGQNVVVAYRTSLDQQWREVPAWWWYNANNNSRWHVTLGHFPAGTQVEYYIRAEQNGKVVYDNQGGANYRVTVNAGPALQWLGNTYHWPFNGQILPADNLWINCETFPQGAATEAYAIYTVDGSTWESGAMSVGGRAGQNDWWHVGLGQHPSGTVIQYVLIAVDAAGNSRWDNNGGRDYFALVE